MKKKSASLDMLLEESGATVIEVEEQTHIAPKKQEFKSGAGRPSKGKRQQFPLYLPDAVYFYLLDCVNVRKRSNRGYSMNNLIHEAIDEWLKEHGAPSIEEIIEKETS